MKVYFFSQKKAGYDGGNDQPARVVIPCPVQADITEQQEAGER